MKTLIAFYSRTGNTRKVAEELAAALKADIDEIIDRKDRRGIIGWLKSGRDAMRRTETLIRTRKDPSKYGLVVIGTPIWAGTMASAVRTYLSKNKFRKVAFFCTFGGRQGNALMEMEKLSRKPLAVLELRAHEIGNPESEKTIKNFCKRLK